MKNTNLKLYTRGGRTYRLAEWWPFYAQSCLGCAFRSIFVACPDGYHCVADDGINRVWRETLSSIAGRAWRRIRGIFKR